MAGPNPRRPGRPAAGRGIVIPPSGYLSTAGVNSSLSYLVTNYSAICQFVQLPERSVEGRPVGALRLGTETDNPGVLLVGGTHARELINPDLLVRFTLQLCRAYILGAGLTYGAKAWSSADVRLVIEGVDLIVLPLLNPDGREHVFDPAGYQWWRKNRSVNAGSSCRGTDLQRNYDFVWPWTIGNTSADPCSDQFKGSAAFSEPETRNVRWLLDTYPRIVAFADIHSFSELILYPWGDDKIQTSDPSQNFQNSAWDGQRGDKAGGYAEYMAPGDIRRFVTLAAEVRDAIRATRGRSYTVMPGIDLYPTSGTSSDYAYSRHERPGGKRKVWAFVIGTNTGFVNGQRDDPYGFQPPYSDAVLVMDEVSSGLMQLLLSFARTTVPDVRELRLTPAVRQVEAARLEVATTGPSGPNAWVIRQDPKGGTRAATGSTVKLHLSEKEIP